MSTPRLRTARIARMLALLPRPVLSALDAWSARVALRRAERRQQAFRAAGRSQA